MLATVIGSHLTREPTASPVLTKWWKLERTLATNFGNHACTNGWWPKFGFGYQIWFCTRLISVEALWEIQLQEMSDHMRKHHMARRIWSQSLCVYIGLGNDLLPDGSKPLPEPMLFNHQQCLEAFSSGPRLNIKTVLSTYGDFHVKDKTAVRTSYL